MNKADYQNIIVRTFWDFYLIPKKNLMLEELEREYLKAKSKNIEASEFIHFLNEVLNDIDTLYDRLLWQAKSEINNILVSVRSKKLNFLGDDGRNLTIEQRIQELETEQIEKLKVVNQKGVRGYKVDLNELLYYSFDRKIWLTYSEFDDIKEAVLKLEEKYVTQSIAKQRTETNTEQEHPKKFEELFYNPKHAEICLEILNELQPPVIDAKNNYIGKAKGVFPLWVKVLKYHKPEPLIKHFKDTIYKDLLNQKIIGLNLSKDASEFRKEYVRLTKGNIELDIKTILSQYSQSGKLGK